MKQFFYLFLIGLISSCTNTSDAPETEKPQNQPVENTTDKSGCKYGKPVAIFSDSLAAIKQQSFELMGQKGVETIVFENGMLLELFQSGCNEIRQEYRFTLSGDFKDQPDAFWFNQAVKNLSYVGKLDERYAVIGLWVGAIEQMSEKMTIGQFTEAELSTFIMVDKIVETESSMVIIVLERRA